MGYDIGEQTVRVLSSGLPPLPSRLEPSLTFPAAMWRGDRYGAVLFLRVWRDGNIDSDCAISERNTDGSWEEPLSWGGGGWIDNPLVRSQTGWDGDQILVLGSFCRRDRSDSEEPEVPAELPASGTFGISRRDIARIPPGTCEEEKRALVETVMKQDRVAREAEWNQLAVRAIQGVAAMSVDAIEVQQHDKKWTIPIKSPCGAFIVGLEHPGPATLSALDRNGEPLPDADGITERSADR
jgi:hypothetical protein